ncbi:MAG: lactonase family protein [Planctomycetaceae bacterium]
MLWSRVLECRRWIAMLSLLSALSLGGLPVQAEETARVYVGTYTSGDSEGVYSFELSLESGKPTEPVLAAKLTNPSFVAFDPQHHFLYAVNEVNDFPGAKPTKRGDGGVSAFRIDSATGKLTPLNSQLTRGGAPCHVSVDATGRNVLVANYGGGSVSVLPVNDDGSLKETSSFVQHEGSSVDPGRQEGPHAHSVNLSLDNKFAFVADLGLDQVLVYRFDAKNGTITPNDPPHASVKPGGGPRHFAFHPSGKFAYTNNEMTLVETAFKYDAAAGTLTPFQYISTIPDDAVRKGASTAETLVHPSGKFLYVSNRGHGSIAAFTIADDGSLTRIGNYSSGGKVPRNFGIDPTGKFLVAANQDNGVIEVLRIDQETGVLTETGHRINVPNPVCIRMFVE